MQMNLATRTQRVLVYLIDYIILGALVGLIIDNVFYKIINFDVSIAQTALTMFTEELAYTLEYMAEGVPYDTTAMMQHFLTYFKYIFIDSIINIAFMSIVMICYLIVLPKLWKKQTIGRMVTKTRVVMKNGEDLSTKGLLKRELIGTVLMYVVLSQIFGAGIIIASIILAYIDGRSLVDYIGNTCLISDKEGGEYPNSPMNKVDESILEDKIDANVEEVYSDDTSDDEYTIL